jgi:DNA polymerase
LPKNSLKDLDVARELVKARDFELIEILYPSLMYVFSQLIRTAFIADANKTFVVADYAAIEARVIAWLSGERWRLDVFNGDGKIYEASYAQAFKVPVESVKRGSPERAKGKIMELALGYGGGINALKAFGADEMGLSDVELQRLVDSWRGASRMITAFWRKAEGAARDAIANPGSTVRLDKGIALKLIDGVLFITLPSGRYIAYWDAHLVENAVGKTEIRYMGKNQKTGKWCELTTYGGKLAENITQAVARDCLAAAMLELAKEGYLVTFHVHDEVIIEVPADNADAHKANIERIMALKGLEWVKGLPLNADAFITNYYKKD